MLAKLERHISAIEADRLSNVSAIQTHCKPFVGHQHKVDRLVELKEDLVIDISDGGVGGEADGLRWEQIAKMVRATSALRHTPTVAKRRAKADANAGPTLATAGKRNVG